MKDDWYVQDSTQEPRFGSWWYKIDGVMNEQTQNAMVFGLMRIQANKSNSIMGALVEADKDWRRLTNLTDAEDHKYYSSFLILGA